MQKYEQAMNSAMCPTSKTTLRRIEVQGHPRSLAGRIGVIKKDRIMATITATQLKRMIDGEETFELINVLSEKDFLKEHIPGSVNVPADSKDFATRINDRVGDDKDHQIVVYCASTQCQASANAANTLELAGFTNVHRFEGGMQDWKTAGYPVESGHVRA
jgi:rhodanese-related sulfurtransferase